MKLIKKLLPVLAAFAVLLATLPVSGAEHTHEPYYITAYNVDIDVAEDNTLRVTEDIDVYFNEARHGIFRYIPLRNNVKGRTVQPPSHAQRSAA